MSQPNTQKMINALKWIKNISPKSSLEYDIAVEALKGTKK